MPPGFSWAKVRADFRFFFATLALVRSNRYDLVHAGEEAVFIAVLLRLFRRIPYVYDMDSSIAQQMVEQMPWLKPLGWFFNWMEGFAIRQAVAVAPVCDALADLARTRGARHVETLYDISQLENPDAEPGRLLRDRWGIARPALLYAGNLRPYQGVDLLMDAFALAVRKGSGLDLVIVGGSDSDREDYKGKAARLAEWKVALTSWVSGQMNGLGNCWPRPKF